MNVIYNIVWVLYVDVRDDIVCVLYDDVIDENVWVLYAEVIDDIVWMPYAISYGCYMLYFIDAFCNVIWVS